MEPNKSIKDELSTGFVLFSVFLVLGFISYIFISSSWYVSATGLIVALAAPRFIAARQKNSKKQDR